MSRRRILLAVLLGLLASACSDPQPPNIVLVIGDDHGWPYAGFMGHEVVRTPTLDRLAQEGTVFTNAQMPASRCRPSLQTLLSGLHPEEWKLKRDALARSRKIPRRQEVQYFRTLPRELSREGYRSWQGGKMWEGRYDQAGFGSGTANVAKDRPREVDGWDFGRSGWAADRCGEARTGEEPCPALAALREFLKEAGDERFFLWFAPQLPHPPMDPPAEFLDPYLERGDLTRDEAIYFAQVTRLDAVVGELLRELEARDLREDTLIVYLSDNGWEIGQRVHAGAPAVGHGKLSLYELGTRTPVVFHWPGQVPAGVIRDDLVSGEDLFPTLLDYGGAQPLPDRRGVSLRPAIESREPSGHGSYVSFVRSPAPVRAGHFVRTPDWRYLRLPDEREELYAIRHDPFEESDLAASAAPELLGMFRQQISTWEKEIATPAPRLELTGRLVDDAGSAVAGVGLRLLGVEPPLQVRTGMRGEFRFQHLPRGRYRVAPGAGVGALSGRVELWLPIATLGSYETLAAAGAAARQVDGTAVLSGTLRSNSGEGVADATLVLRHEANGIDVAVRTSLEGRYRAENLPAGSYRLELASPATLVLTSGAVELGEAERREHDLLASSP